MRKRIFIVEDSLIIQAVFQEYLKKTEFDIVGNTVTGKDALKKAMPLNPDFILLDHVLPDQYGLDLIPAFKKNLKDTKVIVISSTSDKRTVEEAKFLGADDYIVKPCMKKQLLDCLYKVSDEAFA